MWQVTWINKLDSSENSYHEVYETFQEALESIQNWWKSHDYEPNYVRLIGDYQDPKTKKVRLDYGLHHQFYEIVRV